MSTGIPPRRAAGRPRHARGRRGGFSRRAFYADRRPRPRPPHRVSLSLAPGSAWCAPCGRPRPAIWEVGYAKATPGRPRSPGVAASRPAGRTRPPFLRPRLAALVVRPSVLGEASRHARWRRAAAPTLGARRVGEPGGMVFSFSARRMRVLGLWISRFSVPARRPRQTRRHARRMGCAPLDCPCAKPR